MTDKHHIERKKAFKPIQTFLFSDGITEHMTKAEIISNICNKYKSDFAQKILDLWVGVDPYNKASIYYNQDVAFSVNCEELLERLEVKDEIYRSELDTPFIYKEKVDTKKVLLKVVKQSKKYLVLKTFIYMFILFLIVHMGYSYYQVPEQDMNMKFASIISIIILSALLLSQVNKILEEWSIIHGSGREIFYSYLILIVGLSAMFYSHNKIIDPSIYFYATTTIIALVTLIFVLLNSGVVGTFLYRSIIITEKLINLMKYVIPFIFLVLILNLCTSRNHTQDNESENIVKKEYTENKKKTTINEKRVGTSTVNPEIRKASTVNHEMEKIPTKIRTRESVKSQVESCSYYFTTATVNLRSNSSKSSTIRGKIKKSKKVCVTRTYDSWKYINNKGWVYSKYLITESDFNEKNKAKKKRVKKSVDKSVWHCEAKSTRASGWVEKVGKENAKRGALNQCEIRRQTSVPCKIVNCYKL